MSDALMWAGFGKGLADAGSTMANFLMRSEMAKEDRESRMTLRREELAYRAEKDLADREFRESQNALYKKAVGAGGGGGGGKGGIALEDLGPEGKAENLIAMKANMTLPEYKQFQKAQTTGDFSGYAVDTPRFGREPAPGTEGLGPVEGEFSDAVSRKTSALTEETVKRLPPQFKEYADAKRKEISSIIESYALGPAFDDVQKGRQTGITTAIGEGVLSGAVNAGKGGQAVAVMGGKPLVNVEGGEMYNQYTGESRTTALGQSQITENQAQAGAQGALAKKYGKEIEKIGAEIDSGMFNRKGADRLTTMVNSANTTIKSLQEGSKGNTPEAKAEWQRQMDDAVALRDKAMTLLKGQMDEKATPKPEPGAPKAETPPSLSAVKDAPPGSSIGAKTDKGWEVKDKNGKLLGYIRK